MRAAIDGGDHAQAKGALRITVSLIDKLASKRIIHTNAAARLKSRLTKRLAKTSAAA
jgi:small subunit ribosomal protein S20